MATLELDTEKCLSHNYSQNFNIDMETEKARIRSIPDPILPHEKEIELLEELNKFPLGQFLIKNKGLNGEWSAYWFLECVNEKPENEFERWFKFDLPALCATRDRSKIFQQEAQKLLRDDMKVASIPCGLGHAIFTLNFEGHKDIKLYGVDLDKHSVEFANENAKKLGVHAKIIEGDAFNLPKDFKVDMTLSSGLSIYTKTPAEAIALYTGLANALHEGGFLITSYLSQPKAMDPNSPWRNFKPENILIQRAIFNDVLEVKWGSFTEQEVRDHLTAAGFLIKEIILDTQGMFPTVIAQKK